MTAPRVLQGLTLLVLASIGALAQSESAPRPIAPPAAATQHPRQIRGRIARWTFG